MNESGGRSQTIILQLNGREFARAVYKANNEETQRVGLKLASARAKCNKNIRSHTNVHNGEYAENMICMARSMENIKLPSRGSKRLRGA